MQSRFLAIFAAAVVFFLAINVYAQTGSDTQNAQCIAPDDQGSFDTDRINYTKSPLNKLGRGALNTGTCFLEIPAGIYQVSQCKGPICGWTLGMAQGFVTTLLRGATGLFDVLTFAIPPYNKPILKPEYAWQNLVEKEQAYHTE